MPWKIYLIQIKDGWPKQILLRNGGMSINKGYIILLTIVACGFSDPIFTATGSCIYKNDRKEWFQSLTVLNVTINEDYLIRRNSAYDGTFEICLHSIPIGYYVLQGRDTLGNSIPIEEGNVIEVVNFAGDRGGYRQVYRYMSGQLVEVNDK